jgi:hypothetical protein
LNQGVCTKLWLATKPLYQNRNKQSGTNNRLQSSGRVSQLAANQKFSASWKSVIAQGMLSRQEYLQIIPNQPLTTNMAVFF